jgi:predicted ABC-type ATPase
MKPNQPRIRMFAGPNGSGKSMLKTILKSELLGAYINPDEIEKNIKHFGFLSLAEFGVEADESEILEYFLNSLLLKKANLVDEAKLLKFKDQKLDFSAVKINSYFASVAADFIRKNLMKNLRSFSFETVMSSEDKILLLKKANELGYKTYLYFIATKKPSINISRVKHRVSCGGHNVPKDKIISRYHRSLDLLSEAIKNSWRAYIFDNSGSKEFLLAEAQNGKIIEIKTESVPAWFNKFVIKKLTRH